MVEVKLFITKSVDENATLYFESAKKSRKKLAGAKRTLEEFKVKQENTSKEEVVGVSKIKKLSSEKKYWYEKLKWFISSDGYLVVGARDATTNEILVKKHTSKADIVYHTDMAGSPFVVVKNSKEDVERLLSEVPSYDEIPERTIQEAASFTAIHSRAWKMGLGSLKVFWVTPEQVTKEANTGEFMSKGSFMIRGKTNYVDPEMVFACGIIKEELALDGKRFFLSGPREAIETYCDHVIGIEQGSEKSSLVAKTVRSFFKEREEVDVSLDEIIASLPSGGCQVIKVRKRKEDLKPKKKKSR